MGREPPVTWAFTRAQAWAVSLDVPGSPLLYGRVAVLSCCTGLDLFCPLRRRCWNGLRVFSSRPDDFAFPFAGVPAPVAVELGASWHARGQEPVSLRVRGQRHGAVAQGCHVARARSSAACWATRTLTSCSLSR